MRRTLILVGIMVGAMAFAAPETSPIPTPTAPKSKAAQPEDDQHAKDLEHDRKLGAEYVKDVEKSEHLSKNSEMIERVQRIGAEIAQIANETRARVLWGDKRLNTFDYEFKVLEGKDVNAFSLPGGHIYVYEGLLNFIESDDELAGVLAHEVSHASLRHLAILQKESSKLNLLTLPAVLIGILTGNAAIIEGASLGAQAIGSGWSTQAEGAADEAGFDYLSQSRFNPVGMLTMMERLAHKDQLNETTNWGIYRSHPPSAERAQAINALLVEAKVPVRRSQVCSSLAVRTIEKGDKTVALAYGKLTIANLAGPTAVERAKHAQTAINELLDRRPSTADVNPYGDDAIEAAGSTLLQLTAEDAELAKTSVGAMQRKSLQTLRTAIFDVRFRTWDIGFRDRS